jgi:hypothetical protein
MPDRERLRLPDGTLLVEALREKLIVELATRFCGKPGCEHCAKMVRLFEEVVRQDEQASDHRKAV